MFGRKKVEPTPRRFAHEPSRSHAGPEGASLRAADAAIGLLSEALGLDLDFGPAYIFAPSHWDIPGVGAMLATVGLKPNMVGNMIQLLKSPASVARLGALPPGDPLRLTLEEARFGVMLYNPHAENGFNDGLANMQADTLRAFVAEYDNAQARHYAVLSLHKWSCEVLQGKVQL